MNAFFGPYSTSRADNWARGVNEHIPSYRQWIRLSQMSRPANYWVTIDEHPDSINDGYFLNNPSTIPGQWGDGPASYHCGGAGLSFADGHSETHKWRSNTTKIPVRFAWGPSTRCGWPARLPMAKRSNRGPLPVVLTVSPRGLDSEPRHPFKAPSFQLPLRTSQASRRPSPRKFIASKVVISKLPGKAMSHQ